MEIREDRKRIYSLLHLQATSSKALTTKASVSFSAISFRISVTLSFMVLPVIEVGRVITGLTGARGWLSQTKSTKSVSIGTNSQSKLKEKYEDR